MDKTYPTTSWKYAQKSNYAIIYFQFLIQIDSLHSGHIGFNVIISLRMRERIGREEGVHV